MKFDNLGLPQVNGASDLQDSAALAGIMTVFEWPQKIDLRQYTAPVETIIYRDKITDRLGQQESFKNINMYVRHPAQYKYNFSRDQAICLMAGMSVQLIDRNFWINPNFITGVDWLSPAVKGHIERCKGLKSSWFQDLWFWADLYFSAKFKPMDELNQLFCMMMIADSKFIRWYCNANPHWPQAIKNYWCENDGSWRNEPELAALMIEKIKAAL